MKVFIANFGRENYAWPDCLARSTIATMNDVAVQGFWEAGDRESYIQNRMKSDKTAAGISPTGPVASRWFNLMTTIVESAGDVWIHREKDQLWWTTSLEEAPSFEPLKEPIGDRRDVIVCQKACEPWSKRPPEIHRVHGDDGEGHGGQIEWSASAANGQKKNLRIPEHEPARCPLFGIERTLDECGAASHFDPQETSGPNRGLRHVI
jgi:hypothetical protein